MNVRDLTIVLRPRSSWEAVDLGTALAKRYYRDLFRMGLIGFGPFFLVLALLCWKLPFLLIFLVWFLKPIYDRFYLYYLSRRIFGQEVSVAETWQEWKRLLFKGSLSLLTVRRFATSRSMTMAVSDLEGLNGTPRSQRCTVVTRVGGGQAFLVTMGGLFLEALGVLTVSVLLRLFIPQGQGPDWDVMVIWFGQGGLAQTLLTIFLGLSYGLIVLLLEPIYLASGFALYLNSRTSQEAWDIELRFRELAARVSKTRISSGDGMETEEGRPQEQSEEPKGPRFQFVGSSRQLGVVLLTGLSLLTSVPLLKAADSDPQAVIEEVLADEDFTNHVETYQEWVPNEGSWWDRKDKKKKSEGNGSWGSAGSGAGTGTAVNGLFQIIGILALVLLGAVLVILMVNLFKERRSLGEVGKKKGFKRPPPTVVMGMDVTPESLPDDLLAQARHYWSSGQPRLAMSLLYRGALTDLITVQEVVIESSDTESECLAQVETTAPENLASYFRRLSIQWMKAAYSKEEVELQAFESLCSTWPFERRAR